MSKFKYEVSVSWGWRGMEQVTIATGTNEADELAGLITNMADAMQPRKDYYQQELQKAEAAVQAAQQRADELDAEATSTETPVDAPAEQDNNSKE